MTQEGLTLQEMAVNAFIACIFLFMFISIYNYNQKIQSSLEAEQTNETLNQDYAKIAAYDETDISGQDILSFITRYRGSIPVIFSDIDDAHTPEYIVTSNPDELNAIIAGAAGTSSWPYTIYKYNADDTQLVTNLKANEVYQSAAIKNYSTGLTDTPGLNAQQLIDSFADSIKAMRKDKLSTTDGLYGTWHSTVFFKDISCREPECIKVWPVE